MTTWIVPLRSIIGWLKNQKVTADQPLILGLVNRWPGGGIKSWSLISDTNCRIDFMLISGRMCGNLWPLSELHILPRHFISLIVGPTCDTSIIFLLIRQIEAILCCFTVSSPFWDEKRLTKLAKKCIPKTQRLSIILEQWQSPLTPSRPCRPKHRRFMCK